MRKLYAGVILFGISTAIGLPSWAGGLEYPTSGIVYNTKENSSLTYHCTKREQLLECEFTQMSVRKKAKPEDLAKRLADAKKQLPAAIKEAASPESCKSTLILGDVLEGIQTPEQAAESMPKGTLTDKAEFIRSMSVMRKADTTDFLASIRAMGEFCTTPSEASFLKIVRLEHDKEMRTCNVSSFAYKQTFTWVTDYASGEGAWVVQSGGPDGPCGLVQLSRFESEQSKASSTYKFWKYYAKKAVTNRKGSLWPGFSCSDMDEAEYEYDWKERELKLGCDYIKFSGF